MKFFQLLIHISIDILNVEIGSLIHFFGFQERLTAEELQRKAKLNRLFDIWDNEGSGFLNCDEVSWIIGTYKDLRDREIADKGK